eukprot:g808.t1
MSQSEKNGANSPSSSARLLFLVVGVWVSFLLFGKAQEALTRTTFGVAEERFHFTTFLIVAQSMCNSMVAATLLLLRYGRKVSFGAGVKTSDWLIVALGYLGAHKFGLWSLLYIPFPLQVLVKSCKAVPVMFGEILVGAAKMELKKLVRILLLSVGIALFMLYRSKKKKKVRGVADFDYFSLDMLKGCLLILGALICDGIYGPYQNKIIKDADHRLKVAKEKGKAKDHLPLVPSSHHLMLNMNFWQGFFAFAMVLFHKLHSGTNELVDVYAFVNRNPDSLQPLVIFVVAMAVGNLFIYQLQREFGALRVTVTTTVRKLISVMLSSLPPAGVCEYLPWLPFCSYLSGFGNEINAIQWFGVFTVFSSKFTSAPIAAALRGIVGRKKKMN